jgi:cytochrome c oxidase subunit 2
VRRVVLASVAVLVLVAAGTALAGNGGIAPPPPQSPNAHRITDSYWLILAFTGAVFVIVQGSLLWFIFRYRNRGRPREAEGPQVIGHTRLELIWTLIPVLILVVVAGFVFYKLPGIKNVPSATASGGREDIDVIAHQFYWEFRYPNGAVSIDELRAPVHRTVRVNILSHDVDHSWWIPELGGKFDAIPGQRTHTWFKADKVGTYVGKCGEFCGVFHAEMEAEVKVTPKREYERWIDHGAAAALGRSEWEGVCAKCHGLHGEGGYGPQIANNQLLVQQAGLRTLLLNGQNITRPTANYMPPVSRGWNDKQFDSLFAYLKTSVYKGTSRGG